MRPSKRAPDELRPVTLERGVARYAEGSCLVAFGHTRVLCTASLEEKGPPWLRGSGKGWVTAEYAMLPRATHERTRREVTSGKPSGRTQEIQRLIGRSLRAVVNLPAIGERQIVIDCDVIQADGGTRTASITGAWVALHECFAWMQGALHHLGQPAARAGRRDLLRHLPGHTRARPRLCGGFGRRDGRQLRHHGLGRHRRGAGHRRGQALLGGRVPRPAAARQGGRGASSSTCRGRRVAVSVAPPSLRQGRHRDAQCRQAPRDARTAGAVRRRGRLGRRSRTCRRPPRPGTCSPRTPPSRRMRPRRRRDCRRSPTIRVSASTPSTARPACSRPIGRGRRGTSEPPWRGSSANSRSAARRPTAGPTSCPPSSSPGRTGDEELFEGRVFGDGRLAAAGDEGLRLRPDVPARRPSAGPSARSRRTKSTASTGPRRALRPSPTALGPS